MPGTIRTIINEPDFEITTYEWNPRTLQILKIIADDKCNNDNKNKTLDEPYIPDQKETKNNILTKEEQKKPDTPETKKLTICHYKVKQENILATDGNMKIYRQVEEYLEKNLPDKFTRENMINLIVRAWKEIFKEELSLGSAKTYWIKYKRYMEKQGLIKEDKPYSYHKIKEDKEWVEDDDSDDEKDHCYLPEWTNDELAVLEKNIFSFPTKKQAIKHVALELGKTEDEVRLKAKKRGMILR
jgi:hypothetical protein